MRVIVHVQSCAAAVCARTLNLVHAHTVVFGFWIMDHQSSIFTGIAALYVRRTGAGPQVRPFIILRAKRILLLLLHRASLLLLLLLLFRLHPLQTRWHLCPRHWPWASADQMRRKIADLWSLCQLSCCCCCCCCCCWRRWPRAGR